MCNQLIADNSRIIVVMQKTKQQRQQAPLFSFNNSFKNSTTGTPDSSNNASLHLPLSQTLKSTTSDSFSLFDSGSPLFFHSSNKENQPFALKNNNSSSRHKDSSMRRSQGRAFHRNKGSNSKQSKEKRQFGQKLRSNQLGHKKQDNLLPSIKFDLSRAQAGDRKSITKRTSEGINSGKRQESIKVFVRVKPKGQKEKGQRDAIGLMNGNIVKVEDSYYCFDKTFDQQTSQQSIFDDVASDMCRQLFEGFNGTIFAYGQTGSGKTYTIFGDSAQGGQGLIFRCINSIIAQQQSLRGSKKQGKLKCSMAELYKEQIIDMLGGGVDMKLKQGKCGEVYIDGLKQVYVSSENQVMQLVKEAAKSRKVTSTKLNQESSRSHTILTIFLQMEAFTTKLCLIDLAGSEKVCKSGAEGETFEETKKINYSLSCLGNVINALTTRSKAEHIPFRDSKITRLLKGSLTGNFLTSIIINCSKSQQFLAETVSSLKFAERAKKIKVNIQSLLSEQKDKDTISSLHSIIQRLQNDLQKTTSQLNVYKEREKVQPVVQRRKSRQKIFTKNALEMSKFRGEPKVKEQQKIRGQSTLQPQEERSHSAQSELTTRNPIPSERALVQEKIKKYSDKVQLRSQKDQDGQFMFLQEFSSLNVSRSMRPLDHSPEISSLELRVDDSPDISLSFSIQMELGWGKRKDSNIEAGSQ